METVVRIEPVDPEGSAALALLAEAAIEARAIYPESFPLGGAEPTNGPTPSGAVYLLAWQGGRPVASGALRPIDSRTAEIRRMFVTASRRRRRGFDRIPAFGEHVNDPTSVCFEKACGPPAE